MNQRCAFQDCDDPECYFCIVMPHLFTVVQCRLEVDGGKKKGRVRCRLVEGHRGLCQPSAKKATVVEPDEATWWT